MLPFLPPKPGLNKNNMNELSGKLRYRKYDVKNLYQFLLEIWDKGDSLYMPELISRFGIDGQLLSKIKGIGLLKKDEINNKWIYTHANKPTMKKAMEIFRIFIIEQNGYYRAEEAAKEIGIDYYDLIKHKDNSNWKIPYERISNRLYFPKLELWKWIKENINIIPDGSIIHPEMTRMYKNKDIKVGTDENKKSTNSMIGDKCSIKDVLLNIYARKDHLSITNNEFKKLADMFGESIAEEYVHKVLNYPDNGKYKSLYLTALNWLNRYKQGITIINNKSNNENMNENNRYRCTVKDKAFTPFIIEIEFVDRVAAFEFASLIKDILPELHEKIHKLADK